MVPPRLLTLRPDPYLAGEKLDGEWNGSAYPDYGIYTYANGDRYVLIYFFSLCYHPARSRYCIPCARTHPFFGRYGGSWKQGRKHGIGTYYFVSGAKYQGEYREVRQ